MMTSMLGFPTTRRIATALAAVALCSIPAVSARAQANLSVQGFGFPTGQFSTRTYGTGGALAELDPLSPINPASISVIPARMVTFQIEPEFRTVTTSSGSDRTTTARYPNVFGAMPVGHGWVMSLGASTLLDRTATTVFNTTQFLTPTDSVPMTTKFRVDGAMDDIRLAAGWLPLNWLRIGFGAHAITGHNLISITQSFTDSLQFAAFTQQRILGFSGGAVSAGFQLVSKSVTAGFSARHGGNLNLSSEDTLLTSAKVPNRYGASIAYTGIANSAIAIRTSRDDWSSLGSLGTPNLHAVDAWDTSVGADLAGPKIGDRILFLRGGYRTRTLPFQTGTHTVTEQSFTGGLGTAFAAGHVLGDFAIIHSNRSAEGLSASEHAWTMSFGISVRP
jgi:hypothetical protein